MPVLNGMRDNVRSVMPAEWFPAALRPTDASWAVRPALWALLAAAVVAGAGVVSGDLRATGLAYFGVACAAVLVTSGGYRARLTALVCQGARAAGGIVLGVAVADSVLGTLATAAAVAMVSGMVGAIGRMATAGALMAVIGLGFGEFARVRMPGWEQGGWYFVGTLVVAMCALAGWPVFRDRVAWAAVAAVFDRSADLLQSAEGDVASARRRTLAAASAVSRSEVFDIGSVIDSVSVTPGGDWSKQRRRPIRLRWRPPRTSHPDGRHLRCPTSSSTNYARRQLIAGSAECRPWRRLRGQLPRLPGPCGRCRPGYAPTSV